MKFTARQIANFLNGTIDGDPEVSITKLAKIEAGEPGSLTFLANPVYTNYIYSTTASIVVVNNAFVAENPIKSTLIRVEDAYAAFASLLEIYNQSKLNRTGVSENSAISDSARIGKTCYIGEFVVVGENTIIGNNVKIYPNTYVGDNVKIGDNTIIYAGVKIYSDSEIGNNCIIHAGVVIGSDGFGFAQQQGNNFKKIAQIGNVLIEDFVEIGSNTTIDRATLGSTIIRRGVKLDNLIQVGHNVEIGENTVIAAQSGIAGSTKIGRDCMCAGQVGIVGHLTIADNVKIGAQSGVNSSIAKEGAIVIGSPAIDASIFRRSVVHFKNLQSLADDIRQLKQALFKK
ncbi:MAG: UDP-3-O-(3-hydroxymyristoyl)glucosamine N-acyltransferase [Bacteroidales bacterium]|nr:UDP-3-O-(3-hydroxymyristoyl)glucosamine N-acyltransferase [Bacteroidales bacterium]MDZ4204421.1 UDP-3-O-(3-hydroxymyristoyl)glucosamine N-acyltransferase [Bacteroidales bacterium]